MTSLSALPRTDERRHFHAADRIGAEVSALRADVVRTREAFDAMAHQWQGLEWQADGAVLFQGSGWARAIFDFEAARGNAGFDPVVVTLSDGQRLVAVLPLERIRTRARTVLAPLGHAFSQYSDVLVGAGLEPRDVIARLLRTAIKAAPCDAVSFLKVRGDSLLAKGMPDNHLVTGTEQGAPYVALSAFADYAAYFQTIKSKTRKNMRNARNRLERDGAVTHHIAESAEETLDVIERTLSGRANRLKDQGLTSRAFRDTAFTSFCTAMAARADLPVLAMSLRHKDEPIAEQWGFIHKQRYYAFVASRDFSNSDESPGKLHLGEVIHACAERGLAGADLMVPVMPYKLTWATEVVTVRDYALPVTPRGMLVLHIWDKTMRPLFKQTVLRMPKGLRSLMMKLAGRGL
ncbi:GNAT family N-acetyltransferase [Devosia ginsengisoli]|uniref:GNAT family N-acetyltransferase n=1 Tax=Devosia ginsengisoli TaxID=400770 RepID=UPI0026EABCF2|nr:GNAT family N-acetyltransferase [Devosia ginsengisoli]MCR6671197.1 GNAT family N-acetyltransferase [Devosia ginsengisoli]